MVVGAAHGSLLAFFPSPSALRGLGHRSPPALELCTATPRPVATTQAAVPAAVPLLLPALRLAATASVVGVVVGETSTGTARGIGRLVIQYARQTTIDPAKVYTSHARRRRPRAGVRRCRQPVRVAGPAASTVADGGVVERRMTAVPIAGVSTVFKRLADEVDALVDMDLDVEPGSSCR